MPESALVKPIYHNAIRGVGDAGSPWEIQRRRKLTMETMRRLGTPVLLKHMYNTDDVDSGVAKLSPNFDTVMMQSIHDDPFSYGVGYVSTETIKGEWITPEEEGSPRELVVTNEPKAGYEPAPKYRGYGPGYLTYVILPDVPIDVYKLTEEGALIKTQQARIQLPWYPVCGDNDLMIVVELNPAEEIIETFERYQLKQVSPITMRSKDRWGKRELNVDLVAGGNRNIVGQYCEASLIPATDPLYQLVCDR